MNKIDLKNQTCLFIPILLSSCYTRFYYNVRNPIPLFKNKGDLYLDGSSKFGNNAEVTAGYALTNGLALYSGMSYTSKYTTSFYREYVHGESIFKTNNFGLGYFKNEDKNVFNRFEIFADYSSGKFSVWEYDMDEGGYNSYVGRFNKYGVLMNLSNTNMKNTYTQGLSIRAGLLQYHHMQASRPDYWRHYNSMLNSPQHVIFEPAYFGRIGRGNLKFQFQIGFNCAQNIGPFISYPSAVIGLVFNPNLKRKP